jgi:hypothetical protein
MASDDQGTRTIARLGVASLILDLTLVTSTEILNPGNFTGLVT